MRTGPTDFLASPGKRLWAGGFDLLAVAMIFLLVVAMAEGLGLDLSGWGTFGFLFAVYNFGCLAFRDGRTLGKTAIDICVVSSDGQPISVAQAAIRAAVRAAPFLVMVMGSGAVVMAGVVALAVLGAMEVSLIEKSPMRQSLADRLAGTLVVNMPPLQPHRAPAGPLYSATDAEFGGFPKRPPKED